MKLPARATQRFGAAAAVILTLALFRHGGQPQAGQVFQGVFHWLAHLGAYAVIAVAFCYALPRQHWLIAAAIVAAIGIAHEYYEIEAHAHSFESLDALVNAIGSACGAYITNRFTRRRDTATIPKAD